MAVDYFLKISGMEGESQDEKHKGEIEVLSWNWGATQAGTHARGGGGGAGRVDMQDFTLTKYIDKASPKLILACAKGDHVDKAILTCRKAGGEQQEYLKVTFSGLMVSSYQTGGSEGTESPTENVSLNFAKVEFEYREQKPDGTLGGTVKAGYDLKTNKPL